MQAQLHTFDPRERRSKLICFRLGSVADTTDTTGASTNNTTDNSDTRISYSSVLLTSVVVTVSPGWQ